MWMPCPGAGRGGFFFKEKATEVSDSAGRPSMDAACKRGRAHWRSHALDALDMACVLELGAERFWRSDERQAKLAEAMGPGATADVATTTGAARRQQRRNI